MSPAPNRGPLASAGGFVLVGVVMMVLALTIIGVSLYSLSGYEAQFFGRSLFERQALYTASGGIELAKNMLTSPLGSPPAYRLSNVALAVGREGVVSAVAWQKDPLDSTGSIVWGKEVRIRVTASVNGVTRTVTGSFMPRQPDNPYLRLFASWTRIRYVGTTPGTLRARGGAWHFVESAQESAWAHSPPLAVGSSIGLTTTPVPAASVSSFIVDNYPPAGSADSAWISRDLVPPLPYQTIRLDMDAGTGAGDFKFFRSETDLWTVSRSLLPLYSYFTDANTDIRVRGTAIWILPRGAYFIGECRIMRLDPATPANLVIVAGPNGSSLSGNPLAGVRFDKGIWTPQNNDVNVFVVSSGSVIIGDASISLQDIETRNLSVVAEGIDLAGPGAGTHLLRLEYQPELRQVAADLYGRGLLPPVPGARMQSFERVAGSWTYYPGLQ